MTGGETGLSLTDGRSDGVTRGGLLLCCLLLIAAVAMADCVSGGLINDTINN